MARCSRQAPWGAPQSRSLLTVPLGFGPALLGAQVLTNHGWGLFVALAFTLRFASAVIYGMRQPSVGCRPVHQAAGGRTPGARFRRRDRPPPGSAARPARFRWSIALLVQRRRRFDTEAPALLLDPACLCSWCRMGRAFHPNATPQICSEIPPPVEWIFRAGIAYPIRAEMRGSGSGAERYCVFSTGAFVEPIQAWDEPPPPQIFRDLESPAPGGMDFLRAHRSAAPARISTAANSY